jgi:mono/diheme cytochrome c family protein
MQQNLAVGLLTQALAQWLSVARWVLAAACGGIMLVAAYASLRPARVPALVAVLPAVLAVGLMGSFERVREFIRKPYAIADYLYSNGYRPADYPLLQRDGLLAHATYTRVREITPGDEVAAGREVFMLACTRCHTVDGVNGIRGALAGLYGTQSPWSGEAISSYVATMDKTRPFMPPFPGSVAERKALGRYLASLYAHTEALEGAQVTGVQAPPKVRRGEPIALTHTGAHHE